MGVGAVGNAGVFVDIFVGREKPESVAAKRPAERADSVLSSERLLWIGRGIIERVARVEIFTAVIIRAAAVPVVRTAAGGKNDAAAVGAGSFRAELRGAYDEFLHSFGRIVLQEAADEVVVVVAAVHGKIDIEAGAAAERDGGDAGFGGIGRFDGGGERSHDGDVGEAAGGERNFVKVVGSDDSLYHAAGGVERMAGEGRTAVVDFDRLAKTFGDESDSNGELSADGKGHALRLRRETGCGNFDGVGCRIKRGEASFAARVGGLRKMSGGLVFGKSDARGGDGGTGRVTDLDQERAAKFLGSKWRGRCEESSGDKCENPADL